MRVTRNPGCERALPVREFLDGEAVSDAGLVDAEQATRHGGDDIRLAPDRPPRRVCRRKSVERKLFAAGTDHTDRFRLPIPHHR